MAELKNRLMHYAAIAAAIPASGAQAGIVADPDLELVIFPGQSALIDFGPGFGAVFQFELRTTSQDRAAGFYNALFHFSEGNSGQIPSAGFIAEQFLTTTASGGTFLNTYNDPQRLGPGVPVSVGQAFYDPMTSESGTNHDIAGRNSTVPARASGFGSWYPDARGYIGFKMFKDGSFHFGWFDIETRFWADQARNGVAPTLIIHGWGFQDEPRLPINTGEVPAPAAGGLLALALGAAGLRRSRALA